MTTLAPARRGAARPRLAIDLDAVAANAELMSARVAGELMAVVKADGFGHGATAVARTALRHGATRLGVATLDEALALRAAGVTAPLLSWLNPVSAALADAAGHDLELAVPSRAHLDALAHAVPGTRIHLHLDTGLARDGAPPAEWAELCEAARRAERLGRVHVVGVMGHLACADVPDDPANAAGRDTFVWGCELALAAGLQPEHRHLAATAATLTDPQSHHTMCRVGAGLVGIDPSGSTRLHPALTLTAPLVSTRRLPAGTPVGYGHTWRAVEPTMIGLVPLGYADGLPRAASGRAEVMVRGLRRPLVGRISMDMAVVDLGPETPDTPEPGDEVVVFGPGREGEPTTAQWAAWAGTIEHEIVTGLGFRIVGAGTR